MTTTNKPIMKISVGGCHAAIWQNIGQYGRYYTVSFDRTYKNGDDYKSTQRLGFDDLLNAAKVMDAAHSKIMELRADDQQIITDTEAA